MSVEDQTVSFSLEVNVDKAYEDVRRFETVLYRTLRLVARASGSDNLKSFIAELQRLIALLNQLRLAFASVQAARMAAGDPLAWALAGVAVGELAVNTTDLMGSYG